MIDDKYIFVAVDSADKEVFITLEQLNELFESIDGIELALNQLLYSLNFLIVVFMAVGIFILFWAVFKIALGR